VQDSEQTVLEVLYEKPDIIAPIFAIEASGYLQTLSTSLGSKPKRGLLRLHLSFVLKSLYHFLESKDKEELVSHLLFPFLLFSKSRQHTAESVWDIVFENMEKETGKEFEMLKGCAEIVKGERERAGDDAIEKMKYINSALSTKIARGYSVPLLHLVLNTFFSRKCACFESPIRSSVGVTFDTSVDGSPYPRSGIPRHKSLVEQALWGTSSECREEGLRDDEVGRNFGN
jgi:U3 small nucleolar RNA-associated protein 10